jgi:hypothetical protein
MGTLRQYEIWHFGGNTIKVSPIYKYIGLFCTPGLSWSAAQDELCVQAQSAILSIDSYKKI